MSDSGTGGLALRYGEVGRVELPAGARIGDRWQPHLQLVLVLSGRVRVTVDGRPRPEAAGPAVLVLLPGHRETFAFDPDVPSTHWYVHAAPVRLDPALRDRFARLPWPQPLAPVLVELARLALGDPAQAAVDPAGQAELRRALVEALLWRCLLDGERSAAPLPDAVERVLLHLDGALAEPLGLDDLAAAGLVSREQLVRLFRRHLGRTPVAYVWQRRLEAALDLLVATGLPVEVVARRTGFATAQHLSRRVRQETGRTPSQVREAGSVPERRPGRRSP